MSRKRYLEGAVTADLADKMAFVGGPRQVGKTTLAKMVAANHFSKHQYLNWDNARDRTDFRNAAFDPEANLLIFDEVHKFRPWKRYVKGIYDVEKERYAIIVTGSARLDVYRRGGDSLQGRYHYHRLHPFTMAELRRQKGQTEPGREIEIPKPSPGFATTLKSLMQYGGFPEPFLKQDSKVLRRWHNERAERLVREDIRDMEAIRDLSSVQVLTDILPDRVGSLLSINSLREDLDVAHKTMSHWIDVLERFYFHFRIRPFTSKKIRSLKKEPKIYMWDWSLVPNGAARIENLIASHLLKLAHFLFDTEGHHVDLYFLRDTDGRKVDFLLTYNNLPWVAVEAKTTSSSVSKHLKYFANKLDIPYAYQVVGETGIDKRQDGIRIISADRFLSALV